MARNVVFFLFFVFHLEACLENCVLGKFCVLGFWLDAIFGGVSLPPKPPVFLFLGLFPEGYNAARFCLSS